MARYMVDSTSPADALAQAADMYAGYTDGRYVNVAALRAGTNKPVVEISAIGTNSGIVGDCEPGCIWPQNEIVDWVLMRRRSGVEPTVYVGAANLASVVAAFDQRGVARPVAFWTAHYTNTPHYCGEGCSYGRGLSVNVVATQYGGDLVGHYDANTVKDYWPGVDSTEHPAGSGEPIVNPASIGGSLSEEDDMPYSEEQIIGMVASAIRSEGASGAGDINRLWNGIPGQVDGLGAHIAQTVSQETAKVLRTEGVSGAGDVAALAAALAPKLQAVGSGLTVQQVQSALEAAVAELGKAAA